MKTLKMTMNAFPQVRVCALLIGCLLALGAGLVSAYAAGPEDITGTWTWMANNSTGRMHIIQNTDGSITGTMYHGAFPQAGDVTTLEGYYVPAVRRLVFVRKGSAGIPFQFFAAYASRSGNRLAGSFHIWNADSGHTSDDDAVDFNFSATKLSNAP